MSWVDCLLTDSELLILFAENSQIFLKISVIPINFIYLVVPNMLENNQLNSSSYSTHYCGTKLPQLFLLSVFGFFFNWLKIQVKDLFPEIRKVYKGKQKKETVATLV